MSIAIEVKNLKKTFKRRRTVKEAFLGRHSTVTALEDLNLQIRDGEIFGLLGPNGAGKTTLIKVLSSLVLPASGQALVYGFDVIKDVKSIRSVIGLIHSDERSFFWRLTGRQNLEFFAAILQVPKRQTKKRIDELLQLVNLVRDADTMFHSYSTGMKQKLAIARGLLNNPRILLMDEAMRSIDPISTGRIRTFIREEILDMVGGTIVIATNRLDEAADLCDRVAILNKGRLVACGSTEKLVEGHQRHVQYELRVSNIHDHVLEDIRHKPDVCELAVKTVDNGRMDLIVNLSSEENALHGVLEDVVRSGGYIQRCSRIDSSFDAVFEKIVERSNEGQKGQSGKQ
jgi:ABC-2 type transport system ATP-binding protein